MATIKKIEMNNSNYVGGKLSYNYEKNNYNSIVAKEIEDIDDELAQRYLKKNPVENWNDAEPSTIDEMNNLISNMRNDNVPIGVQLSVIARLVSLPYVKMLNGEGRGWAAAGTVQNGPDTSQYNILHNMAVNIRKLNGISDPDYAYGSCAQAVATLIIVLYDSNFPITGPNDQEKYMLKNSDKYKYVGDIINGQEWNDVQPGDIAISETIDGHQHIMLCSGVENSGPYFFEAAAIRDAFSMYPIVTVKPKNDDAFERTYHIFRPSPISKSNIFN